MNSSRPVHWPPPFRWVVPARFGGERWSRFYYFSDEGTDMDVEKAKCPHCESLIAAEEISELVVEDGGLAPMGAGKTNDDVLYVCSSCNTILG